MESKNQVNQSTNLPRELRAVLRIFTAAEELKAKVLPYVDTRQQSIDWPGIWSNDFGGGHSAAIVFAQAIWCDRVETKSDPFDRAFFMDRDLQTACIEALAIRWGLMK